jgi:NADPH:quinone reductase-like Zn-dependent oxidoreductase
VARAPNRKRGRVTHETASVPATMRAVRLHAADGLESLVCEQVPTPQPAAGEALVRVHAAAITRDELEWPVDRLPAIPSYELSGVVAAVGPDGDTSLVGEAVFALTPFDRDGAAADYAIVPSALLAPKPQRLGDVEAAAVPLAALSAWQGLFEHGRLGAGQRVLIHGATGGVGHFATQLAHERGAHVIATVSSRNVEAARALGADEVIDHTSARFEDAGAVDLVFDTAGGERLQRSPAVLREGGRLVSVAEETPAGGIYFVVEPNREQLVEVAKLADAGALRPALDEVFALPDARAAFERSTARDTRGKIVLTVTAEES